jgi:hypothetical protein
MSICHCGSPAHYCQPAVSAGFIYADLRSELNTHLALQALFIQSSPGHNCHCYKLSPFQAHWVRWRYIHLFWPACLFTVHMGSGPSPLSCGVFLPPPLLQAFPLLVAGWVLPLLPSLASLFIYSSVRDFPSLSFGGQGALPSSLCVFFVVVVYYSAFFFSLGGGLFVQGAMLRPRVVCGNTMCCLAHLVVYVFPSGLGAGVWQHGSPPGSPFNMEWGCYVQAGGVEELKFCLFSVVFPLRYITSISPRFHFRKHAFCFLPLCRHLGIS